MSDSEVLQDISDDLKYFIKSVVPNSVYKSENDPSGGGGGGGGASLFKVTATRDDEAHTITLDKTYKQIKDEIDSSNIPYLDFSYNYIGGDDTNTVFGSLVFIGTAEYTEDEEQFTDYSVCFNCLQATYDFAMPSIIFSCNSIDGTLTYNIQS